MKTKIRVLITCEHGGAEVPQQFRSLFAKHRAILKTHRGSDMGALGVARSFARVLHCPLVFSKTTRLLIDLNRSVGHKSLHSEVTRDLPRKVRHQIVQKYWVPYRTKIDSFIAASAEQRVRTVHISSHSFTPKLHGEVRSADVAFLYDPSRAGEVQLAKRWGQELSKLRPDLRIRRNYPYQGKDDGVMKTLRKNWNASTYVGIELEINQKWLVTDNRFAPSLARDLAKSFSSAVD